MNEGRWDFSIDDGVEMAFNDGLIWYYGTITEKDKDGKYGVRLDGGRLVPSAIRKCLAPTRGDRCHVPPARGTIVHALAPASDATRTWGPHWITAEVVGFSPDHNKVAVRWDKRCIPQCNVTTELVNLSCVRLAEPPECYFAAQNGKCTTRNCPYHHPPPKRPRCVDCKKADRFSGQVTCGACTMKRWVDPLLEQYVLLRHVFADVQEFDRLMRLVRRTRAAIVLAGGKTLRRDKRMQIQLIRYLDRMDNLLPTHKH